MGESRRDRYRLLAASHTLPMSGHLLTRPPAAASLQAIGEVQGLDRPHGELAGLGVNLHSLEGRGLLHLPGCACVGVQVCGVVVGVG